MPMPESPARARAIKRGRSRSTSLRDSLAGRSSSMTYSKDSIVSPPRIFCCSARPAITGDR